MKVLVTRSQRQTGLIFTRMQFAIAVRAEISDEERAAIRKYHLHKEVLYQKYHLKFPGSGLLGFVSRLVFKLINTSFTVGHFEKGKKFTCNNILEMIALDEELMESVQNFKKLLDICRSFDREETLEI